MSVPLSRMTAITVIITPTFIARTATLIAAWRTVLASALLSVFSVRCVLRWTFRTLLLNSSCSAHRSVSFSSFFLFLFDLFDQTFFCVPDLFSFFRDASLWLRLIGEQHQCSLQEIPWLCGLSRLCHVRVKISIDQVEILGFALLPGL